MHVLCKYMFSVLFFLEFTCYCVTFSFHTFQLYLGKVVEVVFS